MSVNSLENSILSTLAYFDIFDYPLTLMELYKWIYRARTDGSVFPIGLHNISVALQSDRVRGKIETKNGFYFFKGRQEIIQRRLNRFHIAHRKYKKVRIKIRVLSLVPFIRFIGICNSLSYANSAADDDIDIFIITKSGKIWWSRFFVVTLLKIMRARPKRGLSKDKICASFFISEGHLNIYDLALGKKDIYFQYWITQIYPIYDAGGYYRRFCQANMWIRDCIPLWQGVIPIPQRQIVQCGFWKFAYLIKRFNECLISLPIICSLQDKVKRFQFKILPKNLKDLVNKDTRVVMNDEVLKFHDNDRRHEYLKRWMDKLSLLAI